MRPVAVVSESRNREPGRRAVARALLLVRSKPTTPQREGEYNDWYDRVHLKDVLAIPGVVAASRYRLSERQLAPPGDDADRGYLAVYEIEAEDPKAVLTALQAGGAQMQLTDAMEMDPPPETTFFEEITPRLRSE
jgi:hypothetical protein